jgi:hypothetical protein
VTVSVIKITATTIIINKIKFILLGSNKMADSSIFVLIGQIVLFAILAIILITLIVLEARNLSDCANNQSIWCPSVTCNTPSEDEATTPGQSCFPYAYRYTDDTQSEWICDFPLKGFTPIRSTNTLN